MGYLIKNDVRHLIIDLGDLDYLYSNTINAIININRQMVMSSGRIGILSTNSKVLDILQKAGLHNMMRIYRSEDDVSQDSENIVRHSTSVIDINALKGKQALKQHQDDSKTSKFESLAGKKSPSSQSFSDSDDEAPDAAFAQFDEKSDEIPQADLTLDESIGAEDPVDVGRSSYDEGPARTRLGPQDRLRNANARQEGNKRVRARAWDKAQTGNTGLILTDDTVSGETVGNKEINDEALKTLTAGSSSKAPSILIGLLLFGLIGGLFYVWKFTDLKERFFKSKTTIEEPYIASPPAPVVDTATPPMVEDTTPEVPEKVVTPPPKPKPRPVKKVRKLARPKRVAPAAKRDPEPKAVSGGVRITSNPKGAKVLLNYAEKGRTPITVKLTHKTNIVILQKPGYEQYKTRIALADNKKSLSVDLVPKGGATSAPRPAVKPAQPAIKPTPPPVKKAAPAPKTIMITSNPKGADVMMNGQKMGETPVRVTLNRASNNITIKKDGYQEFYTSVDKTTSKSYVTTTLRKVAPIVKPPPPPPAPKPVVRPAPVEKSITPGTGAAGKIFIASRPPGADIIVDGVSKGIKTNHWLQLPSGPHTITLRKGGMSADKVINVKAGPNKSAYIILK